MAYRLPLRPWKGRIAALVGIMLMALSVRAAVVSVPPLLDLIGPELGFTSFTTGLLAMLAPVIFAVSGLFTPRLIAALGLERTLVLAVLVAIVGQAGRAFVGDVASFLLLSALTMVGYGIGNVVLPPLVKKYFPDRISSVTSGYVTLIAIGTAMSPMFAVPLEQISDWRFSIGFWTLASVVVLIPWAIQFSADRRRRAAQRVEDARLAADETQDEMQARLSAVVPVEADRRINPWRSRVAWGLAIFLAGNSGQTYVYFTWLPPYLIGEGLDPAVAGSALGYFALLGLPVSLLVPLIVPRMKHPIYAAGLFIVLWIIGHAGMFFLPTQGTWWWITSAGLGQGTFAMALLMINLRSRTTYGSGVLAGFSQGVGYAGAAIAPLLFGVVRDATGGWAASFGMLGICLLVLIVGAVMINGPRQIEDDADAPRQVARV
ncbi:CynX/NimT family MFS transporter [Arthrobacter sp. JSM 101049]|uniref:MFS transporter n=1 Tax=Arthrobacter sp. JSM 101049 TaxID=929097 RepID=UPI0035617DB1